MSDIKDETDKVHDPERTVIMDSNKVLAGLWGGSVTIIAFQAFRSKSRDGAEGFGVPVDHVGYFPLPQSFMLSSVSWLAIGGVAVASPELAVALGFGFVLALILNAYNKGTFGGKKDVFLPSIGVPMFIDGKPGAGAQFWGTGSGFTYEPLPVGYSRRPNVSSTGTQGATGGPNGAPPNPNSVQRQL